MFDQLIGRLMEGHRKAGAPAEYSRGSRTATVRIVPAAPRTVLVQEEGIRVEWAAVDFFVDQAELATAGMWPPQKGDSIRWGGRTYFVAAPPETPLFEVIIGPLTRIHAVDREGGK